MELTGLGYEKDPENNPTLLRRISKSLSRNHSTGGEPSLEAPQDHGDRHSKGSKQRHNNGDGQIIPVDHDEMARTRSSVSSVPTLARPLTIGGEPNPEAPHTPEPPSEPPEDRKELPPPGVLSWEAIALLAPFGILGLLARLGITSAVTYTNQAIFPLAWVQAAGCFVMGIAQYQKPFIMS
jgi:hypothetical protein